MKRYWKILAALHVCALVALIALLADPIRSGLIKLLIVALSVGVSAGLIFWIRKKSVRLICLVAVLLVAAVVTFKPVQPKPPEQVRSDYVEALRRYEGVRYVWGGETKRGVDCSGIVRAAWVDSQLRLGAKSASATPIRNAFATWWFDASAKELGAGYRARTVELHQSKSIRANQDRALSPGDFAIVANGTHALAYLGNHEWIQADPSAQKVIIVSTTNRNTWLDAPAVFMRWSALE